VANPPPYTKDEALSIARKCLEEFSYLLLPYATERRGQERNFDAEDCFYVIEESGVIDEEPESSSKYDNWVYKIKGTDIEGEPLTVVMAIEKRNGGFAIIVTAY